MSLYGREFTDIAMDDGNEFELRSIDALNSASRPPVRLSEAKRRMMEAERITERARSLGDARSIKAGLKFPIGRTLAGLGADNPEVLNHALVPFRARPVFLRLVKKRSQALDYAAGGFHVSVTRGLAGGCRDSSAGFASSGTKAGSCSQPINSDEIRALWVRAAEAYKLVFDMGSDATVNVAVFKENLAAANALADVAYGAEGVEPPRDPQTGTSEPATDPVGSKPSLSPLFVVGLGVAAVGSAVAVRRSVIDKADIGKAPPWMVLGGLVLAFFTRPGKERKA
jgi:hypothetical protein